MLTKLLIIFALILPVGAANTDDEIIKNLDFFQSMEMLKEEVAFAANTPVKERKEIKNKKEEQKKNAPEKK